MIGFIRGSTSIKCLQAWSSRVPVVAVGRGKPVFDGDESGIPFVYATLCVPPGVIRAAFVTCGSTGRSSGGGVTSSMSPELYGARIMLTRLGVGVSGGGLVDVLPWFALRFLNGVTGRSGFLNSGSFDVSAPSIFADFVALCFLTATGELLVSRTRFLTSACASLTRGGVGIAETLAERRSDMVANLLVSMQI